MPEYKIVARTISGAVHVLELCYSPPVMEDLDKWTGRIVNDDFVSVDHNGLVNSSTRLLTRNIEAIAIKGIREDF